MSKLRRFLRNEDSTTAIEYSVIAALISVIILGMLGGGLFQ